MVQRRGSDRFGVTVVPGRAKFRSRRPSTSDRPRSSFSRLAVLFLATWSGPASWQRLPDPPSPIRATGGVTEASLGPSEAIFNYR